jgi:hypothetical protein
VTQRRFVGCPTVLFEQKLTQLLVILSPKSDVGNVGQLIATTHVIWKFYENVGVGEAEHIGWHKRVW